MACPDGTFRAGDFNFPSDTALCNQSYNAIRTLSIILALSAAVVIPFKARFTYLRAVNPMSNPIVHKTHVAYGFFSTVYDVSYCVYGVLKATSPTDFILGDPTNANHAGDVLLFFIESSFALLMFAVGINLTYFLSGVSKTMPRAAQERIRGMISFVHTVSWVNAASGVVFAAFPFFSYGNPSLAPAFTWVFLIGTWFVGTFQGLQNVLLLGTTIAEIGKIEGAAGDNDDAERGGGGGGGGAAPSKIAVIRRTLAGQFRLTCVRVFVTQSCWLVFSVVPSLRNLFTYVFILFYYGTFIISIVATRTLWNFGSTKTHAAAGADDDGKAAPVSAVATAQSSKYAVVSKTETSSTMAAATAIEEGS